MWQYDADNYCLDCNRSIYGDNPSCDTNIENDGQYTKPGDSVLLQVS